MEVTDSNGNTLASGDTVLVIKDLKIKKGSGTVKKGTKMKNVRLTDNPNEIEGNVDGFKGLVLRTEFVKKA